MPEYKDNREDAKIQVLLKTLEPHLDLPSMLIYEITLATPPPNFPRTLKEVTVQKQRGVALALIARPQRTPRHFCESHGGVYRG